MAVRSQRGMKRKLTISDSDIIRQKICRTSVIDEDMDCLGSRNACAISETRTECNPSVCTNLFVASTFMKEEISTRDSASIHSDGVACESVYKDSSTDSDSESNSVDSDFDGSQMLLDAAKILASRFEINALLSAPIARDYTNIL